MLQFEELYSRRCPDAESWLVCGWETTPSAFEFMSHVWCVMIQIAREMLNCWRAEYCKVSGGRNSEFGGLYVRFVLSVNCDVLCLNCFVLLALFFSGYPL